MNTIALAMSLKGNGVDTSDATATAEDIAVGKTAYANGEKLTGTKEELVQNVEWVEDIPENYYSSTNIENYIKKLYLPDGITYIKGSKNSTIYISKIKSIVLPNTLKTIGQYAFGYQTLNEPNLSEIVIPSSVTRFETYAFYSCKLLADIYYTGTEEQWNAITKDTSWNLSMGANVSGGTKIHYNYMPE